jgi:hypothetical protein
MMDRRTRRREGGGGGGVVCIFLVCAQGLQRSAIWDMGVLGAGAVDRTNEWYRVLDWIEILK